MDIRNENLDEKKDAYVSHLDLTLVPDQSALRNWDELAEKGLNLYSINPSHLGLEKYVLPWHHHRGDFELIPPIGLTVSQAAKTYLKHEGKISGCNPSFEIAHDLADQGDLGILVASTEKLSAFSYSRFSPKYDQKHLFHVDGLHRGIVGYLKPEVKMELLVFAQSKKEIETIFQKQ